MSLDVTYRHNPPAVRDVLAIRKALMSESDDVAPEPGYAPDRVTYNGPIGQGKRHPHPSPEARHARDESSKKSSQVEENRDAFLAAISHELKTPLAGLRLSAQLLRREFGADEELDLQS